SSFISKNKSFIRESPNKIFTVLAIPFGACLYRAIKYNNKERVYEMIIYWFMLAWVIMFGMMSQMRAKYVCVGEERYEARTDIFMALVTFSVIIFFSGMRSYVADTTAYIKMFNDYPLF
ncbi:hypothetical protein, partial [Clostridium perfringens]|uniref:hypothetical protein n=1 Tax=Clostridium perfringens TaxID=1502 RepID=UPI0038FC8067